MQIKIIKKQDTIENKSDDNNEISICYGQIIKKTLEMCQKIINLSNNIMNNINIEKTDIEDIDFDEQYNKISKSMDAFKLIFGKKYTIIEVITKTTTLINNLQKIANQVGINLSNNEENNQDIEMWDEQDVEIMKQIVDDIGTEQLKKDIEECYNLQHEEKIGNDTKNKKDDNTINVYEVMSEDNNKKIQNTT